MQYFFHILTAFIHNLQRLEPWSHDVLPTCGDPHHLSESQNKATVLSCIWKILTKTGQVLLMGFDVYCLERWTAVYQFSVWNSLKYQGRMMWC